MDTIGPANSIGAVEPEPLDTKPTSIFVCTPTSAGVTVSEASPLPSSVNAIRFAIGGIHNGETHRFMLRLRVDDPESINVFNFSAAGGDTTQGVPAGFDNPWRYWIGAPANVPVAGQTFRLGLDKSIVEVNAIPYVSAKVQIAVSAELR